jgi:hypothetical protein
MCRSHQRKLSGALRAEWIVWTGELTEFLGAFFAANGSLTRVHKALSVMTAKICASHET